MKFTETFKKFIGMFPNLNDLQVGEGVYQLSENDLVKILLQVEKIGVKTKDDLVARETQNLGIKKLNYETEDDLEDGSDKRQTIKAKTNKLYNYETEDDLEDDLDY